jgi:hypothetical protein
MKYNDKTALKIDFETVKTVRKTTNEQQKCESSLASSLVRIVLQSINF